MSTRIVKRKNHQYSERRARPENPTYLLEAGLNCFDETHDALPISQGASPDRAPLSLER